MTDRKDLPTVVIVRRVKPGCEAEFVAWTEGFTAALASFPGCVQCRALPPVPGAQPEWVFVFAFQTPQDLRAWIGSEVRRDWLARADALVERYGQAQVSSGIEQLFSLLPPDVAPPPPVWKVAVTVLLGLYPASVLNQAFLAPLLQPLPLPVRALVSTVVVVAVMTWGVMPLVTRLLKPWLYPSTRRGSLRG